MTAETKSAVELKHDSGVIIAAGGLVWRGTGVGRRIAVIHRRRYGDWCLPKGKLQEGESLEQAAIREVQEETGCPARITGFAGISAYYAKGLPKLVLFWNMELGGECKFEESEEVDQVAWLSTSVALKRLSYAEERDLIAAEISERAGLAALFRLGGLRLHRLGASIRTYGVELDFRIKRALDGFLTELDWAFAAKQLLRRARTALEDNDLDEGWWCFLAAQRMEVFGFEEGELRARAVALRHEAADKLTSWRKNAVIELLDPAQGYDLDHGRVVYAMLLRDAHFHNQYFKVHQLRNQLVILLLILLAAVAVVGLAGSASWFALSGGGDPGLLAVIIFGVMGGAFSGALSLARTSTRGRIPEQIVDSLITLVRPGSGAAAAVAIYAFLRSGILKLGPELAPALYLGVSFAAGFSERLIIRAVESVGAKEGGKE